MRYKSFRIQNFKGIKDTTVELDGVAGASVFAFVGLNESGKTTVLEAIHSFSPDATTRELLGGEEGLGVPFKDRVPRHLISEFTGDVSVTATLTVTPSDKTAIANLLFEKHHLNLHEFPDEVAFQRQQRFANGDFKRNYFFLRTKFLVKQANQRKWRTPSLEENIYL
jgi:hypothetical protein